MDSDCSNLGLLVLEEGLDKAKGLVKGQNSTEIVQAVAEEVRNSTSDAQEWMLKPHSVVNGKSPLEASLMERGALEAVAILGRIYYGSAT